MEIVIRLTGAALAAWGIKLQFFSKPKKELEHFTRLFKATQQLTLQVQRDLEKWIKREDGRDRALFSGITQRSYLEELKSSYRKNLSDELLHKIQSVD